jgi:hypothetical protein
VLVDVVQVGDSDDSLGGDGLVVGLDRRRHAGLAEPLGCLRPDTYQLGQPFIGRRRGLGVQRDRRRHHVVDLPVDRVGQRGICGDVVAQPLGQGGEQRSPPILKA